MNIAIYTVDFPWAGGVDFLYGIVRGLLTQKKKECKIFILVSDPSLAIRRNIYHGSKQVVKNVLYTFKGKPTVPIFKKEKKLYNHIRNIQEVFDNEDVKFVYYGNNDIKGKKQILKKISADVVLPVLNHSFSIDFPIPWIGYLFDFVYKYHTHLYTKEFCLEVDIRYANTLKNTKSVIVNSKETFSDLYKFFPYAKAKAFALPFAPYTNLSSYKQAIANNIIKTKYKLLNPYFIISNQFWLHKSHETAFEALKILIDNNTDFKYTDIVCTGQMTDLSGNDNRRLELIEKASSLNIADKIHFLGHIPKEDQLALMIQSVAVLQPTLFEGGPGGGAVYMAVANGVPGIVSDISVNKEIIDEPLVTFFEALNATDLADKMKDALHTKRFVLAPEAIEKKNHQRLTELGNTLIECIEYTMSQ